MKTLKELVKLQSLAKKELDVAIKNAASVMFIIDKGDGESFGWGIKPDATSSEHSAYEVAMHKLHLAAVNVAKYDAAIMKFIED